MKSKRCSVALAVVVLSLTAGCGLENSVVGGRCRDGMELSGGTCVAQDPGTVSITPTDPPIGTFAADPRGPDLIAPAVDPSRFDPPAPFEDTRVEPPTPFDLPDFVPPVTPPDLVCTAPFVACHGQCISVASDAMNCGACGKICPSNICIDGECQGATPGDVVLIGHDFTAANAGSAQSKVLVNALTIPTTDPIRVLSYEDGASPLAVTVTKALAASGIKGRSIQFTRASSASALTSATLGKSFDIVLLHDASAGDATAIGTSWAGALGTFTSKGGVVVALDGGTSPMPALLSSSGLLTVASHVTLPSATHLFVASASDVVGAQVLSPYAAFGSPVSFQGLPAPSVDVHWVVRAKNADGTTGDAVVVHRTVRDAP